MSPEETPIPDLGEVPLAEVDEDAVDTIVARLIPAADTQRVSVAAFNSSI